MKAKGGQHLNSFQKIRKKRRNVSAQIHVSFHHTRRTMMVINSTSYLLSMGLKLFIYLFFFFLSLCFPSSWERIFIKFHKTVSDKIADSTDYHLWILNFLERSLNLFINKSEKYL